MINFSQEERRRIGIIIVVVVGKSQSSGKNQLIVSQLPRGARRSVEEREQQQPENELRGTWFAEEVQPAGAGPPLLFLEQSKCLARASELHRV